MNQPLIDYPALRAAAQRESFPSFYDDGGHLAAVLRDLYEDWTRGSDTAYVAAAALIAYAAELRGTEVQLDEARLAQQRIRDAYSAPGAR